jgi:hypothetical protein
MTQFEHMLLGRIDGLTAQVSRLAELVGRLEERQISQDDRLEDLEKTPAPRSAPVAKSKWCATKDVGVTAAAIVALVTAVAQAWHAPPPLPSPAPRAGVAAPAGVP